MTTKTHLFSGAFILIGVTALSMLSLCGCKENEPNPLLPMLTLEKSIVDVPNEQGTYSIGYELLNPAEDGEFSAVPTEDWAEGFDFSAPGTISFNIQANTVTEERRNEVTIAYSTSAYEVKERFVIVQSAGKVPDFAIEVEESTEQSVKATIYPHDTDAPYAFMNVSKEYYDDLGGTDEILFANIVSEFQAYADGAGVSLGDFLERNVFVKGEMTGEFQRLYEATDYFVFAVGISKEGDRTTDLIKEAYSTGTVDKTDITFNTTFDIKGAAVSINIKPSDSEIMYYNTTLEKSKLPQISNINRYVQDYFWKLIDIQMYPGNVSLEEAISKICSKGDNTFSYNLMANTEYVSLTFGINGLGLVNTEIQQEDFTTEDVEKSDNVISIVLDEVNTDCFRYTITTTNTDTYVFMLGEAAIYEGMSDEDILQYIRDNYKFQESQLVSGDLSGKSGGLKPLTKYAILLFGYKGGVITTDLTKCEFTTLDICRNPEEATFGFNYYLSEDGKYYRFEITPNPINVRYIWNRTSPEKTAEEVISDWEFIISLYNGDVMEAMFWTSTRGYTNLSANPDTKIYAFGMNEETGEVATEVFFSEVLPPIESGEAGAEAPEMHQQEDKLIIADKVCPHTRVMPHTLSEINKSEYQIYREQL